MICSTAAMQMLPRYGWTEKKILARPLKETGSLAGRYQYLDERQYAEVVPVEDGVDYFQPKTPECDN